MKTAANSILLEQHVREQFRDRWDGWLETYQPGRGSGVGVPDTQIMPRKKMLVPIELKRGVIEGKRLFADDIRPAQVSWHTRFSEAGGASWFIIGVGKPEKVLFFLAEAMVVLATRKVGILAPSNHCFLLPVDGGVSKNDVRFSDEIRRLCV